MTDNPTRDLVRSIVRTEDGRTWLDTSSRPAAIEELATAILQLAPHDAVDAVLTWKDGDLSVIAYELARQLKVARVTIEEDLGLINLEPRADSPLHVLLLAPVTRMLISPAATRTFLESGGHHIVSVISLDAETGDIGITAD